MYTLDDVLLLVSAIKAKSNGDKLTTEQEEMLQRSYDINFARRARKAKGVNIVPPIKDALISCGLDKMAEWYERKDERTSSEVLGYFLYNIVRDSSVDIDTKKDLLLFKALLEKKNKPITLKELFVLAHQGLYDDVTIEEMFNNLEERDKFFERLNGCVIEESICRMDIKGYDPSDLGSIKVDMGSVDNPMLLVSGLNLTSMPKLNNNGDDEVCFITISDLHLDKGCYESDGTFKERRFEENIMAFSAFKEALLRDFAKRGQKIGGIVFTGDFIEGFTKGENKPHFVPENREDLLGQYIRFSSRHPNFEISTKRDSDPGFVAYIAGNHDMTVGKEMFDRFMHTISSDAMFLGAGQARIKVGEEFITFLHHDSLDWGMPDYDLTYQGRNKKNRNVFQFDNFFMICEDHLKTVSDKSNYTLHQLFIDVGERLKKENPELYRFYQPYITATEETPAFFHRNMYISGGVLHHQSGDDEYPKTMKFHDFIKENPAFVEEIIKNGGIIPEYGRNDRYRSMITSLAHFHEAIGSKDARVSFGVEEDGVKIAPVAVSEDYRTFSNGAHHFSVTLYEAMMDKNHVTSIGVIPIVASVKKVYVKGQAKFETSLDYRMGEEVENTSKRH